MPAAFNPNDIRVVLFDIGGVLVELSGVDTLRAWLGGRHSREEIIRMWLASQVARDFETGRIEPHIFADRLISEMSLPVTSEELLKHFRLWSLGMFPGAIELVERVPRRYIRATLCNTNAVHWPELMRNSRLFAAFDRHFASHLMGCLKPDEAAFRHVVDSLGCLPGEILFMDDSQPNVDAATRLGIHAFHTRGTDAAERTLLQFGILEHPT
jgi:glucose-1-phosphatase